MVRMDRASTWSGRYGWMLLLWRHMWRVQQTGRQGALLSLLLIEHVHVLQERVVRNLQSNQIRARMHNNSKDTERYWQIDRVIGTQLNHILQHHQHKNISYSSHFAIIMLAGTVVRVSAVSCECQQRIFFSLQTFLAFKPAVFGPAVCWPFFCALASFFSTSSINESFVVALLLLPAFTFSLFFAFLAQPPAIIHTATKSLSARGLSLLL